MSLQDKNNSIENITDLVNSFVESNQRKRKSLIKKIESSADSLIKVADTFLKESERGGDDWANGWSRPNLGPQTWAPDLGPA